MGIDRISKLDYKIYRSFTWPEGLSDFGKHNLIYGYNGTGKTTLGQLLRDLELRRPPESGNMKMVIDGRDVDGTDFPAEKVQIRVFNSDFVEENVFTAGDIAKPILVLGKENIENTNTVNKWEHQKAGKTKWMLNLHKQKEEKEKKRDNYNIVQAKKIKDRMKPNENYKTYNKTSYDKKASNLLEEDADGDILDEGKRNRLEMESRLSRKEKIEAALDGYDSIPSLHERVIAILDTTVDSAIQSLEEYNENTKWIRDGFEMHQNNNLTKCIFCDQRIPKERLRDLKQQFNDAYNEITSSLGDAEAEIKRVLESISNLELPDSGMLHEPFREEYESIRSEMTNYRNQSEMHLRLLQEDLCKKRQNLSNRIPAERMLLRPAGNSILERLKTIIKKHNEMCENHDDVTLKAGRELERALVTEGLPKFKELKSNVESCGKQIESTEELIKKYDEQITSLKNDMSGNQEPADKLNEYLEEYFPHGEIKLRVQDQGYAFTRNNEPAGLSEGETTAIALLYFLISLEDYRFEPKNGIVVIDDPVSGLDDGALYRAQGFIQEHTKGSGQVFILTHNYAFFKHVRNWFMRATGHQKRKGDPNYPSKFYMLNSDYNNEGRCSTIQKLDPLLENYETEYHYLFERVSYIGNTKNASLEEYYHAPNMARRLLETFLEFYHPNSNTLWEKIESTQGLSESEKKEIHSFVNTHSHGPAIMGSEQDLSTLNKTPEIICNILKLIKLESKNHFENMEDLINQNSCQ